MSGCNRVDMLTYLVEPTKVMAFTRGSVKSISASLRPHVTKLTIPGGNPPQYKRSRIHMEVKGVTLDALSTTVLPVAIARGTTQPQGIIAGKLKGMIPATTPKGTRYEAVSKPVVT